ncbi:MAG: LptF/LptG family permease, partial [Bacteroidota bacterium]
FSVLGSRFSVLGSRKQAHLGLWRERRPRRVVCNLWTTTSPLVTRFDRFVLVRFLAATSLLMVLLVITFVVLDYVEFVDDFLDRGATQADVFGTYYLHYIPEMIRLVSPLAVFLGAIYTTARLAQSMQLAALRSAGVSVWRFARPFLLVGVVLTVALFGFNGWIVPRANVVVHAFQNEYYREAPEERSGSEIVRQLAPDAVLSVGYLDAEDARAFRVTALRLDTASGGVPVGLRQRLDAPEMEWVDSLQTWRLRTVSIRSFSPEGRETVRTQAQLDTTFALLPRDLAQSERDAERMTLPEAASYVESLERSGVRELGRPTVSLHGRLGYPLANLILIALAVPLASRRRKGGQAAQLALGLGVAFVYLAMQKTFEPLGYVGDVPPVLAAWIPHSVFAVLAVVAIVRAHRV